MLVEPGKGDDTKARFALHLLAVHVTRKGHEQARDEFVRGVASQIGGDRPKAVQTYLIERLQLTGTKAIVGALGKALLDPELCDSAARALTSIGDGPAEQFLLSALPKVRGRRRLSIINNLAVSQAKHAADAFRQGLKDPDADIRIAAAWGIARIADASAADALLKCAEAHEGWERINETDACLALAENLAADGKKREAAAIYNHLQNTRTDLSERHIHEAAERGLATTR
jgi:HEAT repeat protein